MTSRTPALSQVRWHRAVIAEYSRLRSFPGVVSVGLGLKERAGKLTGRRVVKIYVREKRTSLPPHERLPGCVRVLVPVGRGTYRSRWLPTDVVELSRIVRAAGNHDLLNPVSSGAEIGLIAASGGPGTFGCVVRIGSASRLLTAGHVLRDSGGAVPKDIQVYQPQPQFPREDWLLGPTTDGFVGNELRSNGYVDAALVELSNPNRSATNTAWDPRVGPLRGFLTADAVQNDKTAVHKVGARTGYTLGDFSAFHARLIDEVASDGYNNVLEFLVSDSEPTAVLAERGDSGAVLVSRASSSAGRIAGLLFAVSTDGRRAFAIPFDRLVARFGLAVP